MAGTLDLDEDPGDQDPRPALVGSCGLWGVLLLCDSPMARSGLQVLKLKRETSGPGDGTSV